MNNFDTEEELFFKYLEENGLDSLMNSYILEYASSMEDSLSRFIVRKYGDACKQFLVAKCFNNNNPYNVKGIRGTIYLKGFDTKINYLPYFADERILLKDMVNKKKREPKESDFDILLIQGMSSSLFSLYQSKLNKVFGDVIDVEDVNYKSFYEAIYRLIKNSSSHEYELCHDTISELGKELFLIKRR